MKILHSTITGKGAPLLILHGFLGMADNWKTLGQRFSENGFRVHLIDQRNHGKSFHADAFSYRLMAEDLLRYMEHHQLPVVHLIGHSMGGKTAMFFATAFPERVAKLVVVDIAPRYYTTHHTKIMEGLNAADLTTIAGRSEADAALATHIPEPPVRQFLLKSLYRTPEKKFAFRFHLPALTQNLEAINQALPPDATYPGATLFIKGNTSGYITSDDMPELKTHFPRAVLEEVEGAGHWVHADQPDTFFEKTMRFFSDFGGI